MCMRSCADQINGVVDDGAATPKKRLDYSDLGSYGLFDAVRFFTARLDILVPRVSRHI